MTATRCVLCGHRHMGPARCSYPIKADHRCNCIAYRAKPCPDTIKK